MRARVIEPRVVSGEGKGSEDKGESDTVMAMIRTQ